MNAGRVVMRRYDRRRVVAVLLAILILDILWGDEKCSCDRAPRVHVLSTLRVELGN